MVFIILLVYIVATANYFYVEYIAEESHLKDVEFSIKEVEMVRALKKKEGNICNTAAILNFFYKITISPYRGD